MSSKSHRQNESPLFTVRPTKQALRESRVRGDLFETAREVQWVIAQLKLLKHWPLTGGDQEVLGTDLDFSKVSYEGEGFFELRLDDAALSRSNLRVFFGFMTQPGPCGSFMRTGKNHSGSKTP